MALTLPELTRIAEAVIREYAPALSIVHVASNDAESGRVELLVTVVGCHRDPCTLLLNLSRDASSRFKADLIGQLRDALQSHPEGGASEQAGSDSSM